MKIEIDLPDDLAEPLAEYASAQKQEPREFIARLVVERITSVDGLADGC